MVFDWAGSASLGVTVLAVIYFLVKIRAFARREAVMELRLEAQRCKTDLAEFRAYVAENYVRKAEIEKRLDDIWRGIAEQNKKLDHILFDVLKHGRPG